MQRHISDSGIYKRFFESHPDGVYILDMQGKFLDANPACEYISGYTLSEFLKMDFTDLIVPDELDVASRHFFTVTRGETQTFETKILHKERRIVHLSVTASPVILDGVVIGIFGTAKNITEQYRDRQRLYETQQLFKLISENSQDVITNNLADGTCLYVSPSVRGILGYDPSEIMDCKISSICHPGDVDYVEEVFERIGRGEDVERFVCRVHRKNGNYVWFETTVKVLRDVSGEVKQIVGVGRDVSAQMNLQESLEHAVRIAGLGHWDWHVTSNILTLSGQMCDILGTQSRKCTYGDFTSLIHPEDRAWVEKRINRSLQTGEPLDHVFRIVRNDGSIRYLHSQGEILTDDDGSAIRMIGTSHDITASKTVELQLAETTRRYQRLVDNSADAIGILEDDAWVFMNEAGLRMFGAPSEQDIIGRNYCEFLHRDYTSTFESMLSSGHSQSVEQEWIKLSGDVFYAEVRLVRFSDSAVQVIIRDISERKQAEESLLHAEKLSAVGQLAAGIAHEIRNPLTALKGFLQLLHERSRGTKRGYVEIMKGELDRIELILSEMLVLARPQAINFEPYDIQLLLREVLAFLSPQALMQDVTIHSDFVNGNPLVECEKNQIKQVFVNVVKNAIEAMPNGGELYVNLTLQNQRVTIGFLDEGEGIPEERIPRLGDPFYTTKEKGTGLGLMVSHKIISTHKGTMSISSTVGKGTKVAITLPVVTCADKCRTS
ncbi:PAS domain S-box protein [Alicyclobacillus ferrooxydans]|uniref:PAS domain S-box protein n=1 Tax=Alicyclobacillus ferrooxydans TaxID=471514 RepID=UPI0006D55768|nr:PAS domain S-box protein [Alicyclobacillus ferrooxydans]